MSAEADANQSATLAVGSDPAAVVCLRPHFRRDGNEVYFLVSRRSTLQLTDKEVELFEAIDGRSTVSALAAAFPDVLPTLSRWAALEVVEVVSPVLTPPRPHLVVIEPHMDDAALSVGGRMLKRRGRERMTILTVVRRSNYTSYVHLKRDYLDVDRIVDLRLQESRLAAALLGAQHRCMDAVDAHLRFRPADQWRLDTLDRVHAAAGAYVESLPAPALVAELSNALLNECRRLEPDELWFPIGLGSHVDHRATRSACVRMLPQLLRERPGLKYSAYEDLPYASVEGPTYSASRHADAIVAEFSAHGTVLRRESEPIEDVFERKLRVVSVFASQFKGSVMGPKLQECARAADATRLAERYYCFEGVPRLPKETALAPDAPSLAGLRQAVVGLLRRSAEVRRIAIVLLPNSHLGNWREDQVRLQAAFPRALLDLHVPAQCAWEVDDRDDARVKVTVIAPGTAGVLQVARREVLRQGTPTLLISWGAYGGGSRRKQAMLRWAFPFRPLIWARTLTDVCAVIAEEAASTAM